MEAAFEALEDHEARLLGATADLERQQADTGRLYSAALRAIGR